MDQANQGVVRHPPYLHWWLPHSPSPPVWRWLAAPLLSLKVLPRNRQVTRLLSHLVFVSIACSLRTSWLLTDPQTARAPTKFRQTTQNRRPAVKNNTRTLRDTLNANLHREITECLLSRFPLRCCRRWLATRAHAHARAARPFHLSLCLTPTWNRGALGGLLVASRLLSISGPPLMRQTTAPKSSWIHGATRRIVQSACISMKVSDSIVV